MVSDKCEHGIPWDETCTRCGRRHAHALKMERKAEQRQKRRGSA